MKPRAQPRRTFLREWREYRGLTAEELAEMIGTSKANVSRYETGTQPYNQTYLELVADALKCEPQDLIANHPGRKIEEDPLYGAIQSMSEAERTAALVRLLSSKK